MRWLIESEGLSVRTFSSGAAFLEDYDASCPGCLVLDMRMPGMNGLEVQSRLIEQRIDLPIIMMAGHGDVPVCAKSFKSGAFDFFEKPANDTALLSRIKQAIARAWRRCVLLAAALRRDSSSR
jgi:FixJ family two-component response regulator